MDKPCSHCGRTLPATAEFFYRDARGRSGLDSWCKDCKLAYQRAYGKTHRDKRREYERRYWEKHPEKHLAKQRRWTQKARVKLSAKQLLRSRALRAEMLAAYGGRCTCCGESEPRFLTLEHTRHDGRQHRATRGGSDGIYRDLKQRGWPKDGYTLLCWNCNMATAYGQSCPHKERAKGKSTT